MRVTISGFVLGLLLGVAVAVSGRVSGEGTTGIPAESKVEICFFLTPEGKDAWRALAENPATRKILESAELWVFPDSGESAEDACHVQVLLHEAGKSGGNMGFRLLDEAVFADDPDFDGAYGILLGKIGRRPEAEILGTSKELAEISRRKTGLLKSVPKDAFVAHFRSRGLEAADVLAFADGRFVPDFMDGARRKSD